MATKNTTQIHVNVNIVASPNSWIEGEAIAQLENTADLPDMVKVTGLPDLHPGRGTPIGAVFETENLLYPHLIGNDIGCGMMFMQTDLAVHKFKLDKVIKKIPDLQAPMTDGQRVDVLGRLSLPMAFNQRALGTVGGGNHFAEFLKLEEIQDQGLFEAHSLNSKQVCLLVHSGSRGLGEAILQAHLEQFSEPAIVANSAHGVAYLERHDHAVDWAVANRKIIAERLLTELRTSGRQILDICHNSVSSRAGRYLHRKGAAPSDQGLVIIPGSRGSLSYLVQPTGDLKSASYSLAHGAGRKWKRSETRGRLANRYKVQDLKTTALGSRVICQDRALLYEEAPEAYKNIHQVIADLQDAGLIKQIAVYRPLITFKKATS